MLFFFERETNEFFEKEKIVKNLKKISKHSSLSDVESFLLNYSTHSLLGGDKNSLSSRLRYDSFINNINDYLKKLINENTLIHSVILGKNPDVSDSYLVELKKRCPYIDIIQSNSESSTIYYVGNSFSLNKYLFLPSLNFKGELKDDLIYLDNIESLISVCKKYFIKKIRFSGTKEESEKISALYKWFINNNIIFLMPIFETDCKNCSYVFEDLVEHHELLHKK